MVMDETCSQIYPAEMANGIYVDHKQLRRSIGECTTNVLGSSVIFTCEGDQINEKVYHDATKGPVPEIPDCTGDLKYVMPIQNGCNNYEWGNMLMTWDNFCMGEGN